MVQQLVQGCHPSLISHAGSSDIEDDIGNRRWVADKETVPNLDFAVKENCGKPVSEKENNQPENRKLTKKPETESK